MADVTQQSAQDTLDVLLPGFAAGGGASIAAVLGRPRSTRQYIADLGVGFLSGILFGSFACDQIGVTHKTDILAVGATMGLFGIFGLRAALAVADAMYLQVEANKDETAKGIVAIVYAIANKLLLPRILAWARTPEIALVPPIPVPPPPPSSQPIAIIQQIPPANTPTAASPPP
jgi:hypothetical protein